MSEHGKAFTVHHGLAAPLMLDNVDTDQIIPSREMRRVGRDGLGQGLFAGWRYKEGTTRAPDPEFILNRPGYQRASVLIAGDNFGCGSSREHAVWALHEFGFRAILARGFGDIFYNNCLRNGVLALVLSGEEIERLAAAAVAVDRALPVTVSLIEQTVIAEGYDWPPMRFVIEPFQKRLLVEGLDPIGLTLRQRADIEAHVAKDRARRPWLHRAPPQ